MPRKIDGLDNLAEKLIAALVRLEGVTDSGREIVDLVNAARTYKNTSEYRANAIGAGELFSSLIDAIDAIEVHN